MAESVGAETDMGEGWGVGEGLRRRCGLEFTVEFYSAMKNKTVLFSG